ncbi:MAG: serine/threonine protein kinase [Gemmataceae bacterium]|nr:serine/threonine protein kinase [Gemmataceae bacterium]
MSESAQRPDDPLAPAKGKSESQLRLVTTDGAVVFPNEPEVNDDAPTIISKGGPAGTAIKNAPPQWSGSIRGRRLAHFELIEAIGVGGMAAVLRARDTQLDRFVALKILPPDMAQDVENIARFHQEARAAAKLDHENIARVFFCGEDQKLHFIAFEFVEGENLRTLLERRGRLPVPDAVRIILQIATGLEHAASRGVVHRDVKPSNIIISPNGRAKLVDMGLARSLEAQRDRGLTQSGVTLGTFDYISPEQALEPREADSRSDIYSLGCTFYHMLTGQTPTPEGTAAKKLHHHQNVAPIDPRELNPDVPDDVAIILGRMMSKNPRERYQRPVHLVQHLMQVAQKVGAVDDLPEGVLLVDAPLPEPPRKRPLLLVSSAFLALAALLLVLSVLPPQKNIPIGIRSGPAGPDKSVLLKESGAGKGVVAPSGQGPIFIKTEQDLEKLLKENKNSLHAVLENDIEISDGLLFSGQSNRKLLLECIDAFEPKTIRFKYSTRSETADLVAGLTLEGGNVTFRNIRFEVEASATPDTAVASLGIKGAGKVRFHKCTFAQKGVPQRQFIPLRKTRVPVASIAVENPSGDSEDRPHVVLDQCYFGGGQVAVGIHGPAEILPTDCAFKPYGALFHLRGNHKDYSTLLRLHRCSAFVINGPAFRLDNTATCDLQVEYSIFSRPETAPTDTSTRDEPDLIRQTDNAEPAVKFDGLRNCYHNLNALWVRPDEFGVPRILTNLEDEFRPFAVDVAKGRGDVGSTKLPGAVSIWMTQDPWKADTLAEAFRLRPDVRGVRTQDMKRALGIEQCLEVTMAPLPALADEPKVADVKLKPNEKVVDPEDAGAAPGVFKSVFAALASAQQGDVILIKHRKDTRDVEVHPIRLDKPGVDVTLRPYPGFAPILTMPDTSEVDAGFFRVFDGRLVLENLEVVLEPDQTGFKAQSIVLMGGSSHCTFRNCVLTLRPAKLDKRVPVSIATLIDPEDAMKMGARPTRAPAELALIDCFVRGEGDVLSVRASRSLDLRVENSLLGLAGSLLTVAGGTKDVPADSSANIRLTNVSAYLSEPLFVLRSAKNPKGLVSTRVETAKDCLFVGLPGTPDRPLVLLESTDASEDNLRTWLDWKAEHNAYCNIDRLIEMRRPDDGFPSFTFDGTRWADYYRETGSKFTRAMFLLPPMRSLWNALPENFQPKLEFKEELNPFGANLGAEMLPKLIPSKKTELFAP